MGLFDSIMHKIFHAAEGAVTTAAAGTAAGSGTPAAATPSLANTSAGGQNGATAEAATTAPPATSPAQAVDVSAVLTQMASQKGGGGNWQTSIVDLLKLLELDSSLSARKQLAEELNVHAGADGSAEENIALQKAVMQKLAENGGKVPDSLKG